MNYPALVAQLDYDPATGEARWRERRVMAPTTITWNKRFAGKQAGTIHMGGRRVKFDGQIYCLARACILAATGVLPERVMFRDGNHLNLKLHNLIPVSTNTLMASLARQGHRNANRQSQRQEAAPTGTTPRVRDLWGGSIRYSRAD